MYKWNKTLIFPPYVPDVSQIPPRFPRNSHETVAQVLDSGWNRDSSLTSDFEANRRLWFLASLDLSTEFILCSGLDRSYCFPGAFTHASKHTLEVGGQQWATARYLGIALGFCGPFLEAKHRPRNCSPWVLWLELGCPPHTMQVCSLLSPSVCVCTSMFTFLHFRHYAFLKRWLYNYNCTQFLSN